MNESFDKQSFTTELFNQIYKGSQEFIECTFIGVDFTPSRLTLSKFIECVFEKCNLSNVDVKNATFRHCEFKDSKLLGINWTLASAIVSAKIENCQLDYAIFNSMTLKKSEITNSSLKEVDFHSTDLTGSDFSGSDLFGANFSRANLTNCDFRGAKNYSIEPIYTIVSKAKFSLPEAISLLKSFDVTIE